MSKHRKRVFYVIFLVLVIVSIGAIFVKLRERKAIRIAQEYLDNKYEQEMKYSYIWFSWVESSYYVVGFSPVNNSKINFQVIVQDDLTIYEPNENSSADNYYIAYFDYLMEEQLSMDAKRLWADQADIRVIHDDMLGYYFDMPKELNEKMALQDTENLIEIVDKQMGEYYIYITSKTKNSLEESADRIFEMIEIIRNKGIIPETIIYIYPSADDEEIYVHFDNWSDITTSDEVLNRLEGGNSYE